MKKFLLAACISACAFAAQAQDETVKDLKNTTDVKFKKDPKDTLVMRWKKGGNFGLNLNQGSLNNWSAGGEKFSLSVNALANLFAFYKEGRRSWDNNLDLAYGIVKTTSLGQRKSADRIDATSKYGYALTNKLNLAMLGNLRTQFANGYGYLKDVNDKDSAVLTSKGFAPAYLLLSPGIDWKPNSDFSLFFSPVTARWVIVAPKALRPVYSVDINKAARNEFGAFASANYMKAFSPNVGFKSKLDLFSNYKHDPQNIDVFWTNMLTAKITRYINFNFQVDMIYDNDIKNVEPNKGPAPQILQLMGVGFSYNFNNYTAK